MQLKIVSEALGLPLEGEPNLEIHGLAGLEDAQAGELSFVTGPRYRQAFENSRASVFLVPLDFEVGGRACLRSAQPYPDFGRAIDLFHPENLPAPGIHPTAVVASDASLGKEVCVGPYVVVGERVCIGDRSRIDAHVTIYPDCAIGSDCQIRSGVHLHSQVQLGDRVIIHSGAVIGSQGFGFAFRPDGTRVRMPHRSGVVIDDDVEIGANTTIDASHSGHSHDALRRSSTHIGRAVKIDNGVQVAHGCEVGEGTTLCAGVGLGGGTRVGSNVFFAGMSGASGNLRVADGTAVLGLSGVINDTEPGAQLLGMPARPRRLSLRILAASKRLPELLKRVSRLERRLGSDSRE